MTDSHNLRVVCLNNESKQLSKRENLSSYVKYYDKKFANKSIGEEIGQLSQKFPSGIRDRAY